MRPGQSWLPDRRFLTRLKLLGVGILFQYCLAALIVSHERGGKHDTLISSVPALRAYIPRT
jgi:hypothetical protein